MTRLTDIADDAAELLTRIAIALPERLHAMRDAMAGQPRAQHFEPVRSQASVLWCWEHERELHHCHREDDSTCTGETIPLNDPTGEAAVRYDKARKDRSELEKHLRTAQRAAERATRILSAYQPSVVINDRAGIGKCEGCEHYCDGVKDNRLRPIGEHRFCSNCRMRYVREKSA